MDKQHLQSFLAHPFSRKFFLGSVFIFLALASLGAYSLAVKKANLATSTRGPNDIKIAASFLKFPGPTAIYPDPSDDSIIWFGDQGGILKYNSITQSVEATYLGTDGVVIPPTSLARSGDVMIVGFQGGIQKYNLRDKSSKILSVGEGLVNGSNIILSNDRNDPNIIWIGTFEGVSRFDVQAETFSNFTTEIGVPGTTWGINKIQATSDAVWVEVSANAYSVGGLARYDLVTQAWQAWIPEDFKTTERVDFWGFGVTGDTVLAATGDGFFQFNPLSKKWDWVLKKTRSSYGNSLAIIQEKAYFLQNSELNYFDVATGKIVPTGLSGYGRIVSDPARGRLILSKPHYEFTILSSDGTTKDITVPRPDAYKTSRLLWGDDRYVFLATEKGIGVYQASNGELVIAEGTPEQVDTYTARKLGDRYLLYVLSGCDMMGGICSNGTLLLFDGLRVEKSISFTPEQTIFAGANVDEIYSLDTKVQHLDPDKGVFVDVSLTPDQIKNDPRLEVLSEKRLAPEETVVSKDETFSVRVGLGSVQGDTIQISVRKGEGAWESRVLPVDEAPYNPFGWPPSINVRSIIIDPYVSERVWIGTDRGLVMYDFKKDTSRVFIRRDGLGDGVIGQLMVFAGKNLVIDSGSGVYILDLPAR